MDVGEIVRRVHWRAWDADAPAPEVSIGEVVAALPVLIESGSAGVVWPRLRDVIGSDHPAGMALEAAATSQAAHNARAERELARVVGRLREVGVEPVLIKGLAVARLYPAGLVRPAGDLDLVVRDEDYAAAMEALAGWRLSFHGDRVSSLQGDRGTARADLTGNVDLHRFSSWYGGGSRAFFDRTERVDVGGVPIEVPGIEDHLRALCLHFLWHGGARPIRLCDIAVILEAAEDDLDWQRCLTGTAAEREQVIIAMRLAAQAFGASLDRAPEEVRAHELPAWVAAAMLERWQARFRPLPHRHDPFRSPPAAYRMVTSRWPDPISAVVRSRGSFCRIPGPFMTGSIFLQHWVAAASASASAQSRRFSRFANRDRVP